MKKHLASVVLKAYLRDGKSLEKLLETQKQRRNILLEYCATENKGRQVKESFVDGYRLLLKRYERKYLADMGKLVKKFGMTRLKGIVKSGIVQDFRILKQKAEV